MELFRTFSRPFRASMTVPADSSVFSLSSAVPWLIQAASPSNIRLSPEKRSGKQFSTAGDNYYLYFYKSHVSFYYGPVVFLCLFFLRP